MLLLAGISSVCFDSTYVFAVHCDDICSQNFLFKSALIVGKRAPIDQNLDFFWKEYAVVVDVVETLNPHQ